MWVNDCVVVIASFGFRVALVSGLLRPIFDKGPVDLEACVILHLSPQFTLEAGDPDQVHQIMRVTLIHYSPIWEVVLPGLFSDARLQRTLDSISSQIIRTIIQENLQERPSLFDAKFREPLKIRSIHSVRSSDTDNDIAAIGLRQPVRPTLQMMFSSVYSPQTSRRTPTISPTVA